MKLAIIGATGRLGGAIAREAAGRGHDVTALGSAEVDVTDPASISRAVAGHDAVVVAVKGPDRLLPRAAQALVAAAVGRFLFVGGAGTLQAPSGGRYIDAPDFPAALRETSLDQAAALEVLRGAGTDVDWSYVSPPPVRLVDGPKTGDYRAEARETPLMDQPDARFAVGDLAGAVVDALEQGSFRRQRFTVGAIPAE